MRPSAPAGWMIPSPQNPDEPPPHARTTLVQAVNQTLSPLKHFPTQTSTSHEARELYPAQVPFGTPLTHFFP